MAALTEAECLLNSGAAYKSRIGLRGEDLPFVFAGFKPGIFSLYYGDLPYVHFDLEGRWQRALMEGVHYLRGLDGATEAIGRNRTEAGLVLSRRRLPFAEAIDLDSTIRDLALDLLADLAEGRRLRVEPPTKIPSVGESALRATLELIGGWDADAWQRQRDLYATCYEPIGFLPPSAPNGLILQPTLTGENGESATLRGPRDFREHIGRVAKLHGRRATQARGVVLAGGDVLSHPIDALLGLIRMVATDLPAAFAKAEVDLESLRLGEIAIFHEAPTGGFPDRAGLVALQSAGLRRVDLGHPDWRIEPSTWNDGIADRLTDLKAAGVAAGLVIPVGGVEVDEAARILGDRLPDLALVVGDIVYLVEAEVLTSSPSETDDHARSLRDRLKSAAREGGFKVVPYRPEKQ